MGIISKEDIQAYRIDQDVICGDCLSGDEYDSLREEDIILGDSDDQIIFCDRCKERIAG